MIAFVSLVVNAGGKQDEEVTGVAHSDILLAVVARMLMSRLVFPGVVVGVTVAVQVGLGRSAS